MNNPRTIRINRHKWACNIDKWASKLFSSDDGRACCLGHFINKVNHVPYSDLDGLDVPHEFFRGKSFLTDKMGEEKAIDNDFSLKAMEINDDILSNEEKEKKLIELFDEHGFNLEFYGELE